MIDPAAPWAAGFDPEALAAASAPAAAFRQALSARAARAGVTSGGGRPIAFVDAEDAPPGAAYEAHVAATGRVPTRDDPHDRCNALMWLHWPRTKARLNALQAEAIGRDGVGARRGPLRDAATLLDESGLVFVASDPAAAQALRDADWRGLLVVRREAFSAGGGLAVHVLGHALLARLATPHKALTGHARIVVAPRRERVGVGAAAEPSVARERHAWLDRHVADGLDASLVPGALWPLPVLGIPGWCSANHDPAFYDDAQVFRGPRRPRSSPPSRPAAQEPA